MPQYVTNSGEMVDAVCHRFYGFTDGSVEAVYDANPHLVYLPLVLPLGTIIELPKVTPSLRPPSRGGRLFDAPGIP